MAIEHNPVEIVNQRVFWVRQLLELAKDEQQPKQLALLAAALQTCYLAVESYLLEIETNCRKMKGSDSFHKIITVEELLAVDDSALLVPELRELSELANNTESWLCQLIKTNRALKLKPVKIKPEKNKGSTGKNLIAIAIEPSTSEENHESHVYLDLMQCQRFVQQLSELVSQQRQAGQEF